MRKRFAVLFVLSAALGTVWHFLYNWLPVPLVGLVAPVDESVWEHLKLLFFPQLAVAAGMSALGHGGMRLWSGLLAALLAMPLLLCSGHYTLLGALGLGGLWMDLSLYYLTLAAGMALGCRTALSGRALQHLGLLVMGCGIWAAALVIFTLAVPPLPIFNPSGR